MNILEELYFGNINPNVKGFEKNTPYGKAMQTLSDREEKLTALLEGEEQSLLFDLVNVQNEITAISELERFVEGFRLGARFMRDTFIVPENGFLKDIC